MSPKKVGFPGLKKCDADKIHIIPCCRTLPGLKAILKAAIYTERFRLIRHEIKASVKMRGVYFLFNGGGLCEIKKELPMTAK